jgi:hypothetical protein
LKSNHLVIFTIKTWQAIHRNINILYITSETGIGALAAVDGGARVAGNVSKLINMIETGQKSESFATNGGAIVGNVIDQISGSMSFAELKEYIQSKIKESKLKPIALVRGTRNKALVGSEENYKPYSKAYTQ